MREENKMAKEVIEADGLEFTFDSAKNESYARLTKALQRRYGEGSIDEIILGKVTLTNKPVEMVELVFTMSRNITIFYPTASVIHSVVKLHADIDEMIRRDVMGFTVVVGEDSWRQNGSRFKPRTIPGYENFMIIG
jgi:hypothetical protein